MVPEISWGSTVVVLSTPHDSIVKGLERCWTAAFLGSVLFGQLRRTVHQVEVGQAACAIGYPSKENMRNPLFPGGSGSIKSHCSWNLVLAVCRSTQGPNSQSSAVKKQVSSDHPLFSHVGFFPL